MRTNPNEPETVKKYRHAPGKTIESRENMLIALAMDEAEKRLRDGTATSQLISHYLRLGTTRERLEQEKLRHETALLETKKKAIESEKEMAEMYQAAISAMQSYRSSAFDKEEVTDEDLY